MLSSATSRWPCSRETLAQTEASQALDVHLVFYNTPKLDKGSFTNLSEEGGQVRRVEATRAVVGARRGNRMIRPL